MNENYPVLTTQRLTLRAFTLDEVPDLCQLAGDPLISSRCLNIPYPYPAEMAISWISEHHEGYINQKQVVFAICLKESMKLVGACGLELELHDNRAEVGYWIGKPYQGYGYATEAVREMLDYGFGHLSLNRMTATSFCWNTQSIQVLKKIGFTQEGIMRKHVLKNGTFDDLIIWGILHDEFYKSKLI